MVTAPIRPRNGGFGRPLQAGLFIKRFLMGEGPEESTAIDPNRGATQTDINYEYKEALARATARAHAERIVSDMVIAGADVTEEQAEEIYQLELKRVSRKFTHMRYHSFLVYFNMLKRLGWVEPSGITESSSIQEIYGDAPSRVYYRITRAGIEASDLLWSNPLFTIHPEYGRNHVGPGTGFMRQAPAGITTHEPVEELPYTLSEIKEQENLIIQAQSSLDKTRRTASVEKLKSILDKLNGDMVEGIEDVSTAIGEFESIERRGRTPEEYREERESAFESIQEATQELGLNPDVEAWKENLSRHARR